jgi:hypothetical protein
MEEPEPDSPFAEFAVKKPSAVEYMRARQQSDRRALGERWLLWGMLTVCAGLGAGGAASLGSRLLALPAAAALGLGGAALGLLIGWLMGAATWAYIASGVNRFSMPLAPELTRGNSWDRMAVWLTTWGTIALTIGSPLGAARGAALMDPTATGAAMLLAWCGTVLGIGLGFAVWLVIKRILSK